MGSTQVSQLISVLNGVRATYTVAGQSKRDAEGHPLSEEDGDYELESSARERAASANV